MLQSSVSVPVESNSAHRSCDCLAHVYGNAADRPDRERRRSDDASGFTVLPKRWLVERTFAWLMHSRRLARDYEARTDTSEAMIRWSMAMVMSRRLARRGC